MNTEEYFSKNRDQLKKVYQAFRKTTVGRTLARQNWNVTNYQEFMKLPITNAKSIDFEDLFIPGEGLRRFVSTGVSGDKKIVYRDIGTIVGYPKDMDETIRNNLTVFLHSKRREGESYYETHDFNHRRMYPDGIISEFETREQLLEYVRKGEVLFIIEYPLMAEWICYQIENALINMKIDSKDLAKRRVYLELSGEPVTEERVQTLRKRLGVIFQCSVEYFITYGSNEIGHIGTYLPLAHGSKIIYEVISSLFIEEIDGEIVISPFKGKGTVLFRYRTGDKGGLFFKDDKPFLELTGKSEDEGILYVAGSQVNIPDLISAIKATLQISVPVGIKVTRREDSKKGSYRIVISVHAPKELTNGEADRLCNSIRNFILESAALDVENQLKIVNIKVTYSKSPIKKEWIIDYA